jgi:hypothetical protein
MTDSTLTDLIRNYSSENLAKFFRWKSRDFAPTKESINHISEEGFQDIQKLGEIQFSNKDQLLVCSIKVTKDLTERSGKKAQFELAKKILKYYQDLYDGIFVFHDANGNFRFSLIYANYYGTRKSFSNYRRFTYYVSPQLTNKTFKQRVGDGDFSSLERIKDAFSVEKVTKEFYQEISYWYFWACQQVRFPEAAEREENGRQVSVIRMITRLIFIWFMREKGLVPAQLFDRNTVSKWLKDLESQGSSYYLAILQNLFFATLNTKVKNRQFRSSVKGFNGYNPDFDNPYKYRHQAMFAQPERLEEYFREIPFLNGGLFDCLDNKRQGDYFDGFSDVKKNQPYVPNQLFFSPEQPADFNNELGTKNQKFKVKGLFEILGSYNFTIDENTADDKDVALDPELLGRVFENLLASFNPETSTTARKATGSYYTPREIVDYMVDESLKAYLRQNFQNLPEVDQNLDWLLSPQVEGNPFTAKQCERIVRMVENVRIVDPAVGSGAFPMGVLNKLVLILSKLDPHGNLWERAQLDSVAQIPDPQIRAEVQSKIRRSFQEKNHDYGRKLYLIQKCIYGVDIQQIAVEIAKLRFFISLLVDETVDREKDNWGIEPLPNLDFKIMQGNSLISVYEGIDLGPRGGIEPSQPGLYADQGEKAELIRLLRDKKAQYQGESDHNNKQALQKEIDKYLLDIFKVNALEQRQDYASRLAFIDRKYQSIPDPKTREKLKAIEKEKVSKEMGINLNDSGRTLNKYSTQHIKRDFFPWGLYFAEVFAEKGGFDIVLGNPPYIGEKGHKELFELVKKADLKEFYMGKMDYFYFFFHLALNLSRPEGHIAFISTNYYPTATGAVKFRRDLNERATIKKLVNFNELKIFETAQGQHNMISLLSKGADPDTIADTCIVKRNGFGSPEILNQIINWQDDQTEYFRVPQSYLYDGEDFQIRVRGTKNNRDDPLQAILNNMRSQGTPLGTLCNINQGIVTGADKVSKKHIEKFHIDANKGDGIFVLSKEELLNFPLTIKEKQRLEPWFKNSDINRWVTSRLTSERVLYLDRSSLAKPNIISHLERFRSILSKRREVENGVIDWWQLQWPRSHSIFIGEKIVAPQRSKTNTFGYNEIPWFASADVYFITKKDKDISLKYILSLLNSKLFYLWLYHRGKRKGETLELYQKPLSEVPIKKISIEDQKPFVDIVNRILDLMYSDNFQMDKQKQEQVKALEEKIDQLVFKLYGLSDTEIQFVKHTGEQKNEQ